VLTTAEEAIVVVGLGSRDQYGYSAPTALRNRYDDTARIIDAFQNAGVSPCFQRNENEMGRPVRARVC
jgi:hypothetical protein